MVRAAKTEELLNRNARYGVVFVVFVVSLMVPAATHAASLYLSPASESVTSGQTFMVTVGVSSADQAMNAVSGDLAFPSSQLQVLSISKSNSIIDWWVQDPSFANSARIGTINFKGIILNPGFTGSVGPIITITFRAIAPGSVPVSFLDGLVLANDGNGTDILTTMRPAAFTIVPVAGTVSPESEEHDRAENSTTATTSFSVATTAPPQVANYGRAAVSERSPDLLISIKNCFASVVEWLVNWAGVILIAVFQGV